LQLPCDYYGATKVRSPAATAEAIAGGFGVVSDGDSRPGLFGTRLRIFAPIFALTSMAKAVVAVPLLNNYMQVISFGTVCFGFSCDPNAAS
jgi:hypothetical protein